MGGCKVNTELMPLKIVLFLWYGGMACLIPYLTIHMRELRISIQETAIINGLIPISHIAGPALAALFILRWQHTPRCVLLSCLVLAGIFSSSLLLVPQVSDPPLPPPAIHILCGPSMKLEIVVDHCGDDHATCPEPSEGFAVPVRLMECSLDCPYEGWEATHANNDAGICFSDDYENRECHVVEENDTLTERMTLGMYLQSATSFDSLCLHPVDTVSYQGRMFHNVTCEKHVHHDDHVNCSLKCLVEDILDINTTSATAFWHAQCTVPEGSEHYVTFSIYLILRLIFQFLVAICTTIIDSSVVSMVHSYHGRYGTQRIWTIIASMAMAPLSGFLVDATMDDYGNLDYSPAFYMFGIFSALSALMIYVLQIEVPSPPKDVYKHLGQLVKIPEVGMLFLGMFFLGTIGGFLESFLFWYLTDLGSYRYTMGLTMTVGGMAGIALLTSFKWIVRKVGSINVIILSGLIYLGRCFGYSCIENPWWSLLLEGLEAATFHLLWVAISVYSAAVAPKGTLSAMQAFTGVVYFGLGRSSGSLIGGTTMNFLGASRSFRIMGVTGGAITLTYGFAYYVFLRRSKNTHEKEDVLKKFPGQQNKTGSTSSSDRTDKSLLDSPASRSSDEPRTLVVDDMKKAGTSEDHSLC